MKSAAYVLVLFVAIPAVAQEPIKHDFRGSKFDRDVLAYSGKTPDAQSAEKYFTLEDEGLRLRYTGIGAPAANNTAGIVWRFHARGDFVVTAKFEILKLEPPKVGWGVGAELYLRLRNDNKDGITLSRRVTPTGTQQLSFSYMTNDENGRRGPKFGKNETTTERSLRGAFRLAREGTMLITSFAEADGEFKEFRPPLEIGNADIDIIRFAGLGGGDPNAVLDMRMLEFELQGKDLGYNGRDFKTPAPMVVAPAAIAVAQKAQPRVAEPVAQPPVEVAPSGKRNLLLLVGVFFVVALPLVLVVATVFFLRLRKRHAAANDEENAETHKMKKVAKPNR